MDRERGWWPGDDRGQALVETALAIPVVLVIAIGVVLAGRVVYAEVAVQAVAREAGRSLAVAPSREQGLAAAAANGRAVADGHGLDASRLMLELDPGAFERGGTARVHASYVVALGALPLFGSVSVTVTAEREQRIEQYRSRTGATP